MDNDKYSNWKDWHVDAFAKTSTFEKVYFSNIFQLIRLKKSSKILEIGFGNGSFIGYAVSQNFITEGVELNESLVELAIKNNFSVYKSIDDISKNNKYDLIVLFDVLEHISSDNIEVLFQQLNQRLEKNGSIFLRFPNGSSPLGLANQHGDVTHCNIITESKLNYWCNNVGLSVVFSRGDIRPFIFKHNISKMPSRVMKILLYSIAEKLVRVISNQSKGVLSSNLEVILKRSDEN